jgi:hypothetical protein
MDRRLSNELGKGLRRRHHHRCRAHSRVDHAALACKPLAVAGHYKPLCACVDRQWALLLWVGREGDVGGTAADNRPFVEAVRYRYRAGIP